MVDQVVSRQGNKKIPGPPYFPLPGRDYVGEEEWMKGGRAELMLEDALESQDCSV
jgi:hypothetical protein